MAKRTETTTPEPIPDMSYWAGLESHSSTVICQSGGNQGSTDQPMVFLLRAELENSRAGVHSGDYVLVAVELRRSRDTLASGQLVIPIHHRKVQRVDQLSPKAEVWGVVIGVFTATQTFPEAALEASQGRRSWWGASWAKSLRNGADRDAQRAARQVLRNGGIPAPVAAALVRAGIRTLDQVEAMSAEDLCEIRGIGRIRAQRIRSLFDFDPTAVVDAVQRIVTDAYLDGQADM